MPKIVEKDRKLPPVEAWETARALVPGIAPVEPELISDGGGLPFRPGRAVELFAAVDPADPAVAALLVQIDRGRRQSQPARFFGLRARPEPMEAAEKLAGWRELARTGEQALFGRGNPPHMVTVAVRRGSRNRWAPLGVSNSRSLRATRDGVRASSWRVDPRFLPGPEVTDLRILVTERTMATGTPAASRLLEPELFVDSERMVLRVYVKPLEGYVGRAFSHETPLIVRLPQPLGVRELVDGAVWPVGYASVAANRSASAQAGASSKIL